MARTPGLLATALVTAAAAAGGCRSTSDYTPPIPVQPGAAARIAWLDSLGLSSTPSALPPHAPPGERAADEAAAQDGADEVQDAQDAGAAADAGTEAVYVAAEDAGSRAASR